MSFNLKRMLATVSVLAIGMTGTVAISTQAAEPEPPVYGNIQDRTGKLTIHKFESGSLTTEDINSANPNGTGAGIDGITFKLHQLKHDLKTSRGWDSLNYAWLHPFACKDNGDANFDMLQFDGLERLEGSEVREATTSNGGTAEILDLPVAAYLVCEVTPTTKPRNSANEPVDVIETASPFIVTVPQPHPTVKGAWLYDIHVYPKNIVTEAPVKTMEVAEIGLKRPNGVSITMSAKIPSLGEWEQLSYYALVDPMSAELVNPAEYEARIEGSDERLVKDVDYGVSYEAGEPNNNAVAFIMTSDGLNKMKKHPNKKIIVSFKATMNALPPTGQVNNVAWLYAGNRLGSHEGEWAVSMPLPKEGEDRVVFRSAAFRPSAMRHAAVFRPANYRSDVLPDYPYLSNMPPIVWPDLPGGIPGSEALSNPPIRSKNTVGMTWSDLTIHKFDKDHADAKLEGAVFEVYLAADQENCQQTTTVGQPIQIGDKTKFITGKNGRVSLEGLYLHTADVPSAQTPNPATRRCFIIKETEAPAGFVTPGPNQGLHPVWLDSEQPNQVLDVPNTRVSTLPALPLTGAQGQLILMVLGSAIMLSSVGVFMVLRRRQVQQR